MITTEQYLKAKKVVQEYEDQEYAAQLEIAEKEFPIGSYAEGQTGWSMGEVWGYGRAGKEVTIKVRRNGHSTGHFFAKYAKKLQNLEIR